MTVAKRKAPAKRAPVTKATVGSYGQRERALEMAIQVSGVARSSPVYQNALGGAGYQQMAPAVYRNNEAPAEIVKAADVFLAFLTGN